MSACMNAAAALLADAAAAGRVALPEPEAKALLQLVGIDAPKGEIARRPEDAGAIAAALHTPVAVKAVSTALLHKSDAGGVICPVHGATGAIEACRQIALNIERHRPDIVLDGYLVEAYRPAPTEWILSGRIDPLFGPVIMFGLGGIYADVFRQVSFRLAPLSEKDIDAMLVEKSIRLILAGLRATHPINRDTLKSAIMNLSEFIVRPDVSRLISEIEINPLAISGDDVLALDAVVLLRAPGE